MMAVPVPIPKILRDGGLWQKSQREVLSEHELFRLKKEIEDFINIDEALGKAFMARYYLITGENDKIFPYIEDALMIGPYHSGVIGLVGIIYSILNDFEKAITFLRLAIKKGDISYVKNLYWVARFSNNKQLQEELKQHYKELIESIGEDNPFNCQHSADVLLSIINNRITGRIIRVGKLNLKSPFSITIEPDDDAFIAKSLDFPMLYGCGDTKGEAIDMLLGEIENLYFELQEDDNFYPDFLAMKATFAQIVESVEQ